MKNVIMALLFIVMVAVCCVGCGNDDIFSDDTFSKEALAPYERLIGASDAEVIKNLGKGEIRPYELVVKGETYYILKDRLYDGCLLAADGVTIVRYYAFGKEHVISGAYKDDPRKVACVMMSATLTVEEGAEIYDSIEDMFGVPSWEARSFARNQYYLGSWDKEDFYYIFRYDPDLENEEGKCSIIFSISDKEFFSEDSELSTVDGDGRE